MRSIKIVSSLIFTFILTSLIVLGKFVLPPTEEELYNRLSGKNFSLNDPNTEMIIGGHSHYGVVHNLRFILNNRKNNTLNYDVNIITQQLPEGVEPDIKEWFEYGSYEAIGPNRTIERVMRFKLPKDAKLGKYAFSVEIFDNELQNVYSSHEYSVLVKRRPTPILLIIVLANFIFVIFRSFQLSHQNKKKRLRIFLKSIIEFLRPRKSKLLIFLLILFFFLLAFIGIPPFADWSNAGSSLRPEPSKLLLWKPLTDTFLYLDIWNGELIIFLSVLYYYFIACIIIFAYRFVKFKRKTKG